MEDRVMDLEDALEDLKAEFEQLLAGEEHEEEENPGIHGGELDAIPGFDGGEEEVDEFAGLMEYTIKVPAPKHGDNGVNTKSTIDNMKNDMGGTTANIAQNFSTTTGGTKGGLLKPTTELQNAGNINVPGANAGKTAFKKKEPGHGAEKAGAKETADNKQSLLKQAKK
jgi:translation elongation factor EF-Tu-like GTPase